VEDAGQAEGASDVLGIGGQFLQGLLGGLEEQVGEDGSKPICTALLISSAKRTWPCPRPSLISAMAIRPLLMI